VISGIHAHRELAQTVQAVTDVAVQAAGFGVAVVSVISADGGMETIAVAGSDEARAELIGVHRPVSAYQDEFAVAEQWGSLRFVPHERAPAEDGSLGWVPDLAVPSDQNAWHPLDALFAPLMSSAGDLIGVLSVDLPDNGLRPAQSQRDLLEVLAVTAGIAIDNALLTERLRAGEEIFRQAFDRTAGGMALVTVDGSALGGHLRVNPAFCAIVGYSAEALTTMTPAQLTHPDDLAQHEQEVADLIAGRTELYRRDKRYLHSSGAAVWVTVTGTIARSADGSPLCAVAQIEDISQRRLQLEQLHHQARHDELTNLPNRTLIFERLRESIGTAERTGRPGVLLFLDLNNFKLVNDQHGHRVGDQVLAMLGSRIRAAVSDADLVGRLGGDELVVIADGLDPAGTQQLADRVGRAVSAPITNKGVAVVVTASVGMSSIPVVGGEPSQILQEADQAMYRNKK
jgi:diguanylate cyclase (GGDEF)-like protein/PAS domain S-box-containing protein